MLEIRINDLENVDPKISTILKSEMFGLIRNRITEFTSLRKLSMEIGTSPSYVANLLNGWIKSTELKLLRRLSERLNLKVEDVIESVVAKYNKDTFIPVDSFPIKESMALASLVGHASGDGIIQLYE